MIIFALISGTTILASSHNSESHCGFKGLQRKEATTSPCKTFQEFPFRFNQDCIQQRTLSPTDLPLQLNLPLHWIGRTGSLSHFHSMMSTFTSETMTMKSRSNCMRRIWVEELTMFYQPSKAAPANIMFTAGSRQCLNAPECTK